MARFLQLHLLTSYPPSNPNRDDLGQPKTAMIGGHLRQRISSQSLKRAWRTSPAFREALGDGDLDLSPAFREKLLQGDLGGRGLHPRLGVRTKDLGIAVYRALKAGGVTDETKRRAWTEPVVEAFAKRASPKKSVLDKNPLADLQTGQLVLLSPRELKAVDALVQKLVERKGKSVEDGVPSGDELDLLKRDHAAVDLALFGRMLADKARFSGEGAAQVAHATTVDTVKVEDDFFTAVDDLNLAPRDDADDEDRGAAHLGEVGYGSGVYYVYLCVDLESLRGNLAGADDPDALAADAARALVRAAATVTPSGKRSTFAHHTYAHLALAERGDQQPRSLAVAFLRPVADTKTKSPLDVAAERLKQACARTDKVYGASADARYLLDNRPPNDAAPPLTEGGTLDGLLRFAADDGPGNVDAELLETAAPGS